jgi:serine/threonine protein phosphatase PrpC
MDDNITRRFTLPLPSAVAGGRLIAFGVSDCGPIRTVNEDAFSFDLDLGLFVVADGMGGHAAGEVASRLAIETIVAFVARSKDDPELGDAPDYDASLSLDANRLRMALQLANTRIFRAGASHEDYHGMGTTVVAVLFSGPNLVVAHAGDSRLYEQYDGRLTQLTKDDSLLEMLAAMDVPEETRERHAQKNVVTNVLGGDEQVVVNIAQWPRVPGRVLMLCTDGVHGVLDDGRIGGILASHDEPRQHAERLVAEAIAAGGRDNATALVVADGETM